MMPSSTAAAARPVSLTSSFSVSEPANEVICPLLNSDGSPCRKRCTGEKRYRSIIEHIRRSHPSNYIPKLPATEESLYLMVNSPPRELDARLAPDSARGTPNPTHPVEYHAIPAAASAAAALAQLHNHRFDRDWDSENEWLSDNEGYRNPPARSSIELPPIHSRDFEPTSNPFSPHLQPHRRKDLASILSTSPPERSTTLPPIQRHPTSQRPRKPSITKRARDPQHRRQKSREHTHLRRMSYERKAYSAEPSSALSAAYGKRWEDLIDAATSATEDVDSERTPVPSSPLSIARASLPPTTLPPFSAAPFQSSTYQASPLQRALTPPAQSTAAHEPPEPFPTIESTSTSHETNTSVSDHYQTSPQVGTSSSPSFSTTAPHASSTGIQIYCAACQNVALLKESYACTECICGICRVCVDILVAERGERRKCPRCRAVGGRFKPFQLDVR